MILQVLDPATGEVKNLTVDDQGRLRVAGTGGSGGDGASAADIGEAVDTELRASPLPVSGTVTVSNQPDNPPTAAAINTALKATAQPVSGPLTDTQLRATAVPVSGTISVSNQPSNPPSASAIGDDLRGGAKLPANILMGLGGAKSVAAGSSSARVQLATSGIVGVSITAVGAAIRYALGNSSVDATSTSHYLPEGQSKDFRVSPGEYIAAIRAGGTDGTLEITELS